MFVPWVASANLVEETPIDLINDLEMARHQELEELDGPFLQSLGKQRVVGIGKRAYGEIPRLIPAEVRLVEQNAHQFRYRKRGVSVVQLDRRVVRQSGPAGFVLA